MLKNMYIHTGYVTYGSHYDALETLFTLNTETVNVHTVAIFGVAPLLFLVANVMCIPGFFSSSAIHGGVWLSGIVFALIGCVATMAYHMFCQIPDWYHFYSALDLFGITLALIAFALGLISVDYAYPLLSFFLPDEADSQSHLASHATLLAVVCSVVGLAIARIRVAIARESPVLLLLLNVAIGLFVTLPCYLSLRGSESLRASLTVCLLLGGMTLYLVKIPERWVCFQSKTLDLIGNSHQIWHVAYCLAFYTYFSDLIVHALGPQVLWI